MSTEKIKKAVLREDLLSIVGNYKEAIILNQFIYWSDKVVDADKLIEKENEIARKHGDAEREPLYGWMYKTAEELADEVMLGLSAVQMRRYIKALVDYGFIYERKNPKYKWDRTLQYRINLVAIARALKKNGYPLSDYKIEFPSNETQNEELNLHERSYNSSKNEFQTLDNEGAIPEITTETTNSDYNTKNNDSNKDFPKGKAIDNNKVFSGEKTGRSPSPDISYEYTIEEFRQFITQKVSYILDEVEPSEKSDSLEPIVAIITDFYEQYYEKFHKRHPILTDAVYTKIILKLLEPIDVIWNEGFYLYVDAYREMIKKFFNTEYGKNSGHTTDYRMPYFMQDTVLENLYYQSGLH